MIACAAHSDHNRDAKSRGQKLYEAISTILFFAGICGVLSGLYQFTVKQEKKALDHLKIANMTERFANVSWIETIRAPIIWLIPKLDRIYGITILRNDFKSYISLRSWRVSASVVIVYLYILPPTVFVSYYSIYSFDDQGQISYIFPFLIVLSIVSVVFIFLMKLRLENTKVIIASIAMASYAIFLMQYGRPIDGDDPLENYYLSIIGLTFILFIPFVCSFALGVMRDGPRAFVRSMGYLFLYYLSQFTFAFQIHFFGIFIQNIDEYGQVMEWNFWEILDMLTIVIVIVFVIVSPFFVILKTLIKRKILLLDLLYRNFYWIFAFGFLTSFLMLSHGSLDEFEGLVLQIKSISYIVVLTTVAPIVFLYTPVLANSLSDLLSVSFTRYVMHKLESEGRLYALFKYLLADITVAALCVASSLLVVVGGLGASAYLIELPYFNDLFDREMISGLSGPLIGLRDTAANVLTLNFGVKVEGIGSDWVVIMLVFALTGALPTLLNLMMIVWVLLARGSNELARSVLLPLHSLLMEEDGDGSLVGVWRASVIIGFLGGVTVTALTVLWDGVLRHMLE